jgi:hypothetical protein
MYENLVKLRINERMREGLEEQSLARSGRKKKQKSLLVAGSIVLFVVLIIGLSGCQVMNVSSVEAKAAAVPEMSMAERIRFQDQLWDQKVSVITANSGYSMADRIRFQDQIMENFSKLIASSNGLSMADRIRFQDKLWALNQ